MDEKKRYIFVKDFFCNFGKIDEGREITFFRGIIYLDGVIVPEPYASFIKKIFNSEKFLNEYIKIENVIKNKL